MAKVPSSHRASTANPLPERDQVEGELPSQNPPACWNVSGLRCGEAAEGIRRLTGPGSAGSWA